MFGDIINKHKPLGKLKLPYVFLHLKFTFYKFKAEIKKKRIKVILLW